jgi:hypothetical protein
MIGGDPVGAAAALDDLAHAVAWQSFGRGKVRELVTIEA